MIFAHQGDEELLESKSLVAQVGGHIRQEYQIDENPYLKRKHRVWMLAWSGEPQTNIQNP
jgi:hypothetical protein